jgi:hypothetical protein
MAENPIRCVATFGVAHDRLSQVKAAVGDIGAVAAQSPVGAFTPVYDEAGDSVELSFAFASHDDLDTSVSRLGPDLERLAALAPLTDLHVFGELTPAALAAFEPFRPTLHAETP